MKREIEIRVGATTADEGTKIMRRIMSAVQKVPGTSHVECDVFVADEVDDDRSTRIVVSYTFDDGVAA